MEIVTAEDHLKLYIGQLMTQLAMAHEEIEKLKMELRRREEAAPQKGQ